MSAQIFLSYAHNASSEDANALALALKAADLSVFLDARDIEYGDIFTKTILDALLDSQVFVLFATPEYFKSWFCLREFEIAKAPIANQGTDNECLNELPWFVVAGNG